MVKIFKIYVLNIFIAATFFLSQVENVNANHLKNTPQKEDAANYVIKQVKNVKSKAVGIATLYVPAVSYDADNKATVEGKVEKAADPLTIGMGILVTGYVLDLIGTIIGWVKDIVSMFK
ncbi:hypothetical protein V3564_01365 [Bartonella sp. B12(2025)]